MAGEKGGGSKYLAKRVREEDKNMAEGKGKIHFWKKGEMLLLRRNTKIPVTNPHKHTYSISSEIQTIQRQCLMKTTLLELTHIAGDNK